MFRSVAEADRERWLPTFGIRIVFRLNRMRPNSRRRNGTCDASPPPERDRQETGHGPGTDQARIGSGSGRDRKERSANGTLALAAMAAVDQDPAHAWSTHGLEDSRHTRAITHMTQAQQTSRTAGEPLGPIMGVLQRAVTVTTANHVQLPDGTGRLGQRWLKGSRSAERSDRSGACKTTTSAKEDPTWTIPRPHRRIPASHARRRRPVQTRLISAKRHGCACCSRNDGLFRLVRSQRRIMVAPVFFAVFSLFSRLVSSS